MRTEIICPNCDSEIEITEVMSAQLSAKIRGEVEAEFATRNGEFKKKLERLTLLEQELKGRESHLENEVEARLNKERATLQQNAVKEATDKLGAELLAQNQELATLRDRLRESRENELALEKAKRDLQDRAEALELEVARKVNAERVSIRNKALKDADEQHRLSLAEKDHKISGLLTKIDELKRRAEQGSQQIQGEVLELELERSIRDAFPEDDVCEVAKGRNGEDLLQVVRSGNKTCGSISWETKRAKTFQSSWLGKLREDQRAAGSDCAILVTDVLPKGVDTFALVDGVFVCSRSHAIAVGTALRTGIKQVAKARSAAEGRSGKKELVYDYLCSSEFQNHVAGVVEALVDMVEELEKEQRSTQTRWKKRRKQLQRAFVGAASFYGDLQGLAGNALPDLKCLGMNPPNEAA